MCTYLLSSRYSQIFACINDQLISHFNAQDQFLVVSYAEKCNNDSQEGCVHHSNIQHYDIMYCPAPCRTGDFHQVAILNNNGDAIYEDIPSIPGKFTNFGGRHIIYSNTKVTLRCIADLRNISSTSTGISSTTKISDSVKPL